MERPNWVEYYLNIAKVVGTRATCNRLRVGAVLVKDHVIIATGYNGAPSGMDHCDDVGHLMIDGHCKRTIHAEENVLLQAGSNAFGSKLYITHRPCTGCLLKLIQAGVDTIAFLEDYQNAGSHNIWYDLVHKGGINVIMQY